MDPVVARSAAVLRIAVNVSALQRTGADPRRLVLEITERAVLGNVGEALTKMQGLREIGVGFSLDDFGTGYSSLSYLSRPPLHELKIDKSFVAKLPENRNDAVITQTIITMATSLGLDVVAEGVESDAQRAFLRDNGCHLYQGYLFNRPRPIAEFEKFAAAQPAPL